MRGGGAAGAVCHGELRAGLCEAGAGVDPEEVVEDEGPCGLFARGDGVQVVRVLVRGRAEGGALRLRLRRGLGRVGVVRGVCMGLIRCRCRCRWLCLAVRLGVRLGVGVGVGGGAGMGGGLLGVGGGGCDGWLSTGAVGGDGEGRAWALCGAKDDGDGDVAGVCLICHRDVADENKVEASSPLPGAAPSSAPAALPCAPQIPCTHTHALHLSSFSYIDSSRAVQ